MCVLKHRRLVAILVIALPRVVVVQSDDDRLVATTSLSKQAREGCTVMGLPFLRLRAVLFSTRALGQQLGQDRRSMRVCTKQL